MYKIIIHTKDDKAYNINFENEKIIKLFPDELHVDMSFTDIGDLILFLTQIRRDILYDN